MASMASMQGLTKMSFQRVSTAEHVRDHITTLILDGSLKPGTPLRENTIATTLGVSRNTVREAVLLLGQSRLIRHEMHRGAIVAEPTKDALINLYDARRGLEVGAVSLPASAEVIAGIKTALDDLELAADAGDDRDIVEKDLAFHAATVRNFGSERIDAFYAQLAVELSFYLNALASSRLDYAADASFLDEHRRIYAAIAAQDNAAAARCVEDHIDETIRRLHARLDAVEA
ncbi:DNA-binding transcriptional regulator, GntR family [Cryobacterium psychrotolerans]|uniref:DNA-binding transcriptional regulator, GntR family n=2 Tax=Microbacteriaceae TaxID=85023 RepID=A0A1G9G8K6_9MICO|nr:GntR family transcriptional regulator [Cryobacterium sp. TMT1-2-1]TFD83829.1 GntR family transcriptional regulator [Cryobacterium psychrotolerans]SDK97058.1 DNA-binding transcriptional regulator, GntR family [Cryobacterium psychrotolerans]